MFKISTPRPAGLPEYQKDLSTSDAKNGMDLDEDPSMTSSAEARVAIPGEAIANSQDWMRCDCFASCASRIMLIYEFGRGHGTYVEEAAIVASVSGLVERVNKLVSVRALRSK